MKLRIFLSLLWSCLFSNTFADVFIIDGIEYTTAIDGQSCVVSGYEQSLNGNISIPTEVFYNGKYYDVDRITNSAFKDCINLTSVTINGVFEIGAFAFKGCSALTQLTIGESVKLIGDRAFEGCNNLKTLRLNAISCQFSGQVNSLFPSLTQLIFGNKVKVIPAHIASGCNKITSIIIPNSVTNISILAFSNCTALTSITIPDSVSIINSGAFYGCI